MRPESDRRKFLKALGFSTLPLLAAGEARPESLPPSAGSDPDRRDWLTPVEQFFVRNHLGVPPIDRDQWKLGLEGKIARPREWTFSDLSEMQQVSNTVTLECAENLPGGSSVGNAHWEGVLLATLLKEAGIDSSASEVILEGADRGLDEHELVPVSYARSLPLQEALSLDTMVALEMNGQPLTPAHGGPARLIVPGWYGMAHVKWVTKIRVVSEPFRGFYMSKRYFTARRHPNTGEPILTRVTHMGVKSQIHYPRENQILKQAPCLIRGAAWAGCEAVERVQVSTDGGATWEEARLSDARARCAWVHWSHPWRPPSAGSFTVQVRAFDRQGSTQPVSEELGKINRYDNRWLHRVRVSVTEGPVPGPASGFGETL